MSTSEIGVAEGGGPHAPSAVGAAAGSVRPNASVRRPNPFGLRLLRSELRLVFGRRRNIALLGALACIPILIAVDIRLSGGPRRDEEGGGPAFIGSIAGNG